MGLDIRTLLVVAALVEMAAATALYLLHRSHPEGRGPGWWTIGSVLTFAGLLLLSLRGLIPGIASVVAANVLIMAGLLVHWIGLRRFLRQPGPGVWPFLTILPAMTTALWWWYSMTPNLGLRIVTISFSVALASLLMARDLFGPERRLPVLRFLMLLFLANAAFFLMRATLTLAYPPRPDFLAADTLTQVTMLYLVIFYFALPLSYFLLIHDELRGELHRQASHDHLTGIPNRRAFHMLARHEIGRARRTFDPLSMLLLDLDHFKQVNDRFGHAAGDKVLRDFSSLLTAAVREQDIVCRFGGEEFVILLPGTGPAGALALAERIRSLAESRPVEFSGNRINYTVSIGIALSTTDDMTIESVLERADRALYRAKSEGRNRVSSEAGEAAWATGADQPPSSPSLESKA